MSELKIGVLAKDRVTGFTGIVEILTEYQANMDQVTLQPRELKDGQPQKSASFDITQVEVVDTNPFEDWTPPKCLAPKAKMGLKYKCENTGFAGVMVARAYHLNGCIRVALAPKVTKDHKSNATWFDDAMLEEVAPMFGKKKTTTENTFRDTGGPEKYGSSKRNF